jgi:uncharacterized membrane protein
MDTWRGALPYALAIMFVFTAAAHFNSMRHELVKMMPSWVPYPMQVLYLTGGLEILGAMGLTLQRTRRIAGICLMLFLIAVFPANVHAAEEGVAVGPLTALWFRAPLQALFLGLLWWGAVRSDRNETGRPVSPRVASAR